MRAELLDRHSRPLSLTVYGGNLIQYAVPLVVDLDGLIGAIRPGTGRYPLVTAGYSESVSATSAPWLTSYLETRSDKLVVQTGMSLRKLTKKQAGQDNLQSACSKLISKLLYS